MARLNAKLDGSDMWAAAVPQPLAQVEKFGTRDDQLSEGVRGKQDRKQVYVRQPGCALIDRQYVIQWAYGVTRPKQLVGKRLWWRQPIHERHQIRETVASAMSSGVPQTLRLKGSPDSLFWQCTLTFSSLADSWSTATWVRSNGGLVTRRERDVLSLICEGLRRSQISERLLVSFRTVERCRQRLRRKTGMDTSVGQAMWAVTRGLWHPADSVTEAIPENSENNSTSIPTRNVGGAV